MLKLFNRLKLTQQWISATLLALLPLSIAVAYGGWSLASQTSAQRQLVTRLERINQNEAALIEKVTDLERSARQYSLIQNPKFLTLLRQDIGQLNLLTQQLRDEVNSPFVHQKSQALQDAAKEIEAVLSVSFSDVDNSSLQTDLQNIKSQRDELIETLKYHSQKLLDESDATFNLALKHLLIIGILAIPGTILLVVLSSAAVSRPIWRLAGAIQDLGHARWQKPISIKGPADLQSLGENLEWMRLRLVVNDRQKQAFLQHITHEFKTPLAGITEAGWLLRDQVAGTINEAQREIISILLRNADNLQELIQQLLNYNTVTQGLVAKHNHFDFLQICEKIQQKIIESRPQSQCQWQIPKKPLRVYSDQQLISMILSNLLSNAHDFSGKDGKVSVNWGEDVSNWWFSVEDNGPGISPDEMKTIFKPFFQGRARRSGPLKGTGMGLAIVHECASLLSGKLSLRSTLHRGTRFTLQFSKNNEIHL